MDELNELIESMMIDIGLEGIGSTAGIGLMWGMFLCGSYFLFHNLLELLVATI